MDSKLIYTKLLALFSYSLSFAQNHTLRGSVSSSSGAPLDIGNVVILNPSYSSVIKGTYVENNAFLMEGIPVDSALLKITCYDHYPYYQDLIFNGYTIDLGTIELKNKWR